MSSWTEWFAKWFPNGANSDNVIQGSVYLVMMFLWSILFWLFVLVWLKYEDYLERKLKALMDTVTFYNIPVYSVENMDSFCNLSEDNYKGIRPIFKVNLFIRSDMAAMYSYKEGMVFCVVSSNNSVDLMSKDYVSNPQKAYLVYTGRDGEKQLMLNDISGVELLEYTFGERSASKMPKVNLGVDRDALNNVLRQVVNSAK